VPCYCSSPLPSNGCLPANGKCDKYWVSSSDKTLDYMIHWSRVPEPEIVGPAASENTVPRIDWRLERDLEPQSCGSSIFPNPGSEEQCNDQDLLKRHHNTAKVTPTRGNPHHNLLLWGLGRGPWGGGVFLRNLHIV